MASSKSNVQITPAKKLIVPNDRISKKIFNLTAEDLRCWIEQQKMIDFVEMTRHKKFGEIISPLKLSVEEETFTLSEPLDQFHCAVLCAGISELYVNNHHTTDSIIYRAITGKVGRNDAEPSKNQLVDIHSAVDLLMRLQMTYNPTNLCETVGYNEGYPTKIVSTLLPCKRIETMTINGKATSIIELLGESPLLQSAQLKNNQILTYDIHLLDVPNMNNSRMNIGLKHYSMRRVCEISLHRQLRPIITFPDVFEKCRIENASLKTKKDAREVIVTLFEHLKSKGVMKSFEVTKRGNSFYSIEFVPVRRAKAWR